MKLARRVYLAVECNRDENLFKILRSRQLIPDTIELIPKHLPRPHDIKTILNILNVYNGLIIATDLDIFSTANQLCSNFAGRINGSQISGKTLTIVSSSQYIIRATLDGAVKTIGIISLGLDEQIIPAMNFQQRMVEDYYVKLMHRKGLIPSLQRGFQTSKDLLDNSSQIDEIQVLESSNVDELGSVCQDIIRTVQQILGEIGIA